MMRMNCDGCGGEDCVCCEIYYDSILPAVNDTDEMYSDEFEPIDYDEDEDDY